jgi:hypothetical protein
MSPEAMKPLAKASAIWPPPINPILCGKADIAIAYFQLVKKSKGPRTHLLNNNISTAFTTTVSI